MLLHSLPDRQHILQGSITHMFRLTTITRCNTEVTMQETERICGMQALTFVKYGAHDAA